MSILQSGARVGAATFVVGFSLAWPQAAGIASADKLDQDSPSVSAGPAKSGTSSARAHRSNASRPSDNAPATAATRGRAAATAPAAASAHSTAAARSAPTTNQTRRVAAGRAAESAIADAVLAAIGKTQPDPASTAETTTASAAVATVVITTTPTIASSTSTAVAPSPTSKISTLTVPRANDVVSSITDLFSGLGGSVQSLVEGVGLLVRRILFNQAPTVDPVQTTGQTTGLTPSTITGSINAVDPEGDQIVYAVVQPQHGEVTIDSNGNYTYEPTAGFTGADAFTVTARDSGLHINLLNLGGAPGTEAIVSVTQSTGTPRVGFNFVFGNGARFWTSPARAALQQTAISLSSYFIVNSPVTVTYSVTGQRKLTGTTLASAGSDLVSTDPGFYGTVVQEKILTGVDPNGSAPDGQVDWNFGYSWALGNSVASNQYDFQSTAMHELLHTFGFLSVVDSAGKNTGTNWSTFDSFVVTSNGTAPINHTTYTWITTYNTNLTGGVGGLYFGGPNAEAAYGGKPVPLYTPKPWESGSSMSHLDDATFTGANAQLMNAVTDTGLGIRILSPIEVGILKDLGYNVANPPQTLAIFVIGFAFIRRRKRNAELAAV